MRSKRLSKPHRYPSLTCWSGLASCRAATALITQTSQLSAHQDFMKVNVTHQNHLLYGPPLTQQRSCVAFSQLMVLLTKLCTIVRWSLITYNSIPELLYHSPRYSTRTSSLSLCSTNVLGNTNYTHTLSHKRLHVLQDLCSRLNYVSDGVSVQS